MIHLIHGILTARPSSVEGLIPYLHEFDVRVPDYGWIDAVGAHLMNGVIVGSILPYVQKGDICIGHSNGCAIAYELMQRGAPFQGAAFINAALTPYITRPPQVKFIDFYYNGGDDVTQVAQIAATFHLVDPVWGEAGHSGYIGTDGEIQNIDCSMTPGMPIVLGHSDFFNHGKLASWGPYLVKRLHARIAATSDPAKLS